MKNVTFSTVFVLIHLLFVPAQATANDTTIWNAWYLIRQKDNSPISYYNEKLTESPKLIKIQVNLWRKSTKGIEEEHLGAAALNNPLLQPKLYNFQKTTADKSELKIDGSVDDYGKIFTARISKGKKSAPQTIKVEMLPKLFLSSCFPAWLRLNKKRITPVQPISFQTILEDQIESEVKVAKGYVIEMSKDTFAKEKNLRKLRVNIISADQYWWVNSDFQAVKIEIPSTGQTVDLTDELTAKQAFLK